MLTTPVGTSQGYNYQPEFMDMYVQLTLANGASCVTGQGVKRDLTQLASAAGADRVVLPTVTASGGSATQGQVVGVYQGPSFTNNSGASAIYPITVRTFGLGVVNATSGANLAVGLPVIWTTGATAVGAAAGAQPSGSSVGIALPTGANITPGALLSTGLINCAINVQ